MCIAVLCQSSVDVCRMCTQQCAVVSGERIRRNSLTTLHSLPSVTLKDSRRLALGRQMSVPHGYNVKKLLQNLKACSLWSLWNLI